MANAGSTTNRFEGIYITSDAALYLTATLRRDLPETVLTYPVKSRRILSWIRRGLTSPDLKEVPGRDLLMTFEDLISMRVIAVMRALDVSWLNIYRAERWLREQTGYPRPFAVQRVWTETVDVFAELPTIGLIAASRHGQWAFPELIGEYLQPVEDLTFIRHNGVHVAYDWTPHDNVLINPEVQFGEPCIQGTRIPTRTIWRISHGGDSLAYLAKAFRLSEAQVNHALRWEDRLLAAKDRSISR